MKIYVCEQYHDNDCGIYADKEAALAHMGDCRMCECLQEYELVDREFRPTDFSVSNIQCENCLKHFRSDQHQAVVWQFSYRTIQFCSEECKASSQAKQAEYDRAMGITQHGPTDRPVFSVMDKLQ